MKHRARRRAAASDNTLPAKVEAPRPAVEAFSFGDPSPVLEGRDMLADVECYRNGDWYEPPLSMVGLAKSLNASVHHASAIWCKVNILASTFQPSAVLSRGDFTRLALDFLLFGNCYAERRESMTGKLLSLKPALAKYTRVGVESGRYFFVNGWRDTYEFEQNGIWHLQAPDINQEVYGVPQYVSALQSAWLNESATLFRRRYYLNGSHAGFILYMTDTASNVNDVDKLREAMRNSKGPGNFRNLFVYAPGGKKDGLQILPVSEIAAKDEFFNIKNCTRDDVLAAHRVPPQLLGTMPNNTGGFGDVTKAAAVFGCNEIEPLQAQFLSLNEWAGQEVVRFCPYQLPTNEGK
ncbi:bacteriophage capsid portal protein [Herbaspirillum sp. GW103]|uniref:phage portal protein n=1 Tax=Herbaspirillum sp. GW103 TaxID=1175306 RepID=UPI00025E2721|nr:phage portal protein [Herbaspirillum sp. GW103]EIJ46425.1 bacteriophage capsid portal protein [Herbaspirillum sp. GW103]